MSPERFRILVVCHANLCRSPMAERLTRRAFTDHLGADAAAFEVVSSGTHAGTNLPMHPLAAAVLRERGVDETGFGSQRLAESQVKRADLVLTATRGQRSACVALDPSAVHRTFTILQFGRYGAAMSSDDLSAKWPAQRRLQSMIEQVATVRGDLPVVPGTAEDLRDPVQSPVDGFRCCAAEIQSVVDVMVGLISLDRIAPT